MDSFCNIACGEHSGALEVVIYRCILFYILLQSPALEKPLPGLVVFLRWVVNELVEVVKVVKEFVQMDVAAL